MQEGFVEINSVPTRIITRGQWIHDKFEDSTNELILIITGNPGLPGFYTSFASTIYNDLDEDVPIWIIGHAGHDAPRKELKLATPPIAGNEHLYDLSGQLHHKIDFVTRFIPKNVKVYLIGHSIGSKFCLDLLKVPDFNERIQHCYLMFPTIERMAESVKGRDVPFYNRIFFLLRIVYNLFAWLPRSWRTSFIRWKCRKDGMRGDEFLEPSLGFANPSVIDRVWFMTLDEMNKVGEVDEELIKSNIHRLKLYYGTNDGWVPKSYHQDMIDRFPGIDAELCKNGYEHAFVLSSSSEVGKMVAEWINLKRIVNQIQ